MADIILAEFAGQAWLVRGEQHIDHLLANTLGEHCSIEVIACESKSQVDELWRAHEGADADESLMWLIHPAIVNRVRGLSGEIAVNFAAWSASLDDAAHTAIRSAAQAVEQQSGCTLAIVRFIAADGPAMATDLANLRSGLLEAQLVSLGLSPSRILRETQQPARAGLDDRIELAIRSTLTPLP